MARQALEPRERVRWRHVEHLLAVWLKWMPRLGTTDGVSKVVTHLAAAAAAELALTGDAESLTNPERRTNENASPGAHAHLPLVVSALGAGLHDLSQVSAVHQTSLRWCGCRVRCIIGFCMFGDLLQERALWCRRCQHGSPQP